MTTIDPNDIASRLIDDGDTFDLPDGRTIKFTVEPDYDTGFDDFADVYGQVGYDTKNAYGRTTRPGGFDGNAERLYYGNDGPWWWQPPKDGPKRGAEGFAEMRTAVLELLAYGCVGHTVELLAPQDQADAVGHRPVLAIASLWGTEPMPSDQYRTSILVDLIAEVLGDV